MYAQEQPIGLFKGFSASPRELDVEVVVPHQKHGLPNFGEFILIEMSPEKAAVGRVIHYHPTGPLASRQGENYLAEMGRDEMDFPESIRELVLRYALRVILLGVISKTDKGFNFEVGVRSLANFGMHVRMPSVAALRFLANVGLDDNDPSTVPFGKFAIGQNIREEITVNFSINRLKSKRSFVFARAGYGKSNLIKYLLSKLYSSPPDVGLLIFDPEGEYALPQKMPDRIIPGLASLPELKDRIRYYTLRKPGEENKELFKAVYRGGIRVNFADFSGRAILNAFVPAEKHEQVWANWIKGLYPDKWRNLVETLSTEKYKIDDGKLADILSIKKQPGKENVSVSAVKNNLIPAIERLHKTESKLAANLLEDLGQGNIVIVDISLLSGEDGLALAGLLMQKVFFNNVKAITGVEGINCVPTLLVMEEAQAILGSKSLSESSIFVRWAKEGRKYQLGAILITQQPGAIAQEILSQGDNFFVMHLLNQDDLDCLRRVNAHYAPDLLEHIRNEPIKGNCFFWSAPEQPYVISAKVRNFDNVVEETVGKKKASEKMATIVNETTLSANAAKCCELINKKKELWVFKIQGQDALAVSYGFLRKHLSKELSEFSDDQLDKIIEELSWRADSKANLGANWGDERIVIFPSKIWQPVSGKTPQSKEISEIAGG